jgi:hypothetical protein
MALAAIFAGRQPTIPAAPHLVTYLMLAISVFYAVLAVWAIMTVIGILRLRSWARYSILVIGGGLAVLGIFAVLGTLVSRTMFTNLQAEQPNVDPHIFAMIFVVMVVMELLIAGLGIWWLVYFTRGPICDLFNAPVPIPARFGSRSPEAHGAIDIGSQPPKPANGLFSSPEHAPTSIKILGWFFLIGFIFCLPLVFLPIPAFILGFIVPLKASRLLFLVMPIVTASIGYGLLKLKNSARLAAIALTVFGLVNSAISVTPWYQDQFRQYMAQFMTKFMAMMPSIPGQPTPIYHYPTATVVFNTLVAIAINGYILWLLHRHRATFRTPAPPPNPMVEA